MLTSERVPLTYEPVNGLTFAIGFIAFVVTVVVVLLVGVLVRRQMALEKNRKVREDFLKDEEFFNKVEDFRNDFQ